MTRRGRALSPKNSASGVSKGKNSSKWVAIIFYIFLTIKRSLFPSSHLLLAIALISHHLPLPCRPDNTPIGRTWQGKHSKTTYLLKINTLQDILLFWGNNHIFKHFSTLTTFFSRSTRVPYYISEHRERALRDNIAISAKKVFSPFFGVLLVFA